LVDVWKTFIFPASNAESPIPDNMGVVSVVTSSGLMDDISSPALTIIFPRLRVELLISPGVRVELLVYPGMNVELLRLPGLKLELMLL